MCQIRRSRISARPSATGEDSCSRRAQLAHCDGSHKHHRVVETHSGKNRCLRQTVRAHQCGLFFPLAMCRVHTTHLSRARAEHARSSLLAFSETGAGCRRPRIVTRHRHIRCSVKHFGEYLGENTFWTAVCSGPFCGLFLGHTKAASDGVGDVFEALLHDCSHR